MDKTIPTESNEEDVEVIKTKISEDLNSFDVYGSIFNLPVRYEVTMPLGSGAYG